MRMKFSQWGMSHCTPSGAAISVIILQFITGRYHLINLTILTRRILGHWAILSLQARHHVNIRKVWHPAGRRLFIFLSPKWTPDTLWTLPQLESQMDKETWSSATVCWPLSPAWPHYVHGDVSVGHCVSQCDDCVRVWAGGVAATGTWPLSSPPPVWQQAGPSQLHSCTAVSTAVMGQEYSTGHTLPGQFHLSKFNIS